MNNEYYVPIDEPGYVVDVRSSALLNTDLNALREYKQKKKQASQIQSMQDEINMLKAELEIIKTHLKIS
jgi:hypothetical protein